MTRAWLLVATLLLVGLTVSNGQATSLFPEQIHISVTGREGEMLIVWLTNTTDSPSQVSYGTVSGSYPFVAQGNVTTYTYNGYNPGGIYSVTLTHLYPNTVYYYRCGKAPYWSNEFFFTSAPTYTAYPVTIGVTGDVGTDTNSNQTIQRLLNDPGKLNMVFHVGDLSYANGVQPVWDVFGKLLQPLAAYLPYMPTVGNHENFDTFIPFSYRYALRTIEGDSMGGDFYYSFNYGPVHFVILSSETDYSITSAQVAWFQSDMAKTDRTKTPWIVAGWHRPWYNSNTAHHLEGEAMRIVFEPLFAKYNVDIGFVGHVHAYERVKEVFNFVEAKGATSYVTVGAGGTPEGVSNSWYPMPAWSASRVAQWGHGRLTVHNSTHASWAWILNSDGSVYDENMIIRTRPPAN